MLLKISEVAKRFRVDDTTVRRWCKVNAIKHTILPTRGLKKCYRIHEDEVNRYLNNTKGTA